VRRLISLASLLSLLICVATVLLWVRSRVTYDELDYSVANQLFFVDSARGVLDIGWDSNYPSDGVQWHAWSTDDFHPELEHNFGGFGVTYGYDRPTARVYRVVKVPDWCVCVVTAAIGVGTGLRSRQKHCTLCCCTCSYNLTGNTSGVCPECGSPISKIEPVLSSKK